MSDTREKLSPVTVGLHWIVAVLVIGMLSVGVYMAETETWWLYPWHKSFGVLVLLILIPRVGWRLRQGWPPPAAEYELWVQRLSRAVHWTLLICVVLMPISGIVMSAMAGHNVPFFGFELVASNPDPDNPGKVLPRDKTLAGIAHEIHEYVGYLLATAVLLHIAGALKHHFMDRDGTLRRMLGAKL